MRAGQLRHPVKLQSLTAGQDELGQPVQTWADVASLWADIRYLSGVEAIKADATVSLSKASIQIRKRDGVTAAQRIVDAAGVVYQILDVLPDMQHRDRINLPCEVVRA